MKKYLNRSLFYAILAMAAGVFFREFTKYMDFEGRTYLSKVHPHIFVLGMFFFLIIYLLSLNLDFEKSPKIDRHLLYYNCGLLQTFIMFMIRGIFQVLENELSKGQSAMISGLAGLGHSLLAVALILVLLDIGKMEKFNK